MPNYPWKNDQFKFMPTSQLIDVWGRAGYVYETSVDLSISSSGNVRTIFIVGDRPVVIFSRQISYNGDGVNLDIYRDPDYSGGTSLEYYNANDVCPQPNIAEPSGNDAQGDKILSGATVSDVGIKTRATVYVYGNESNQGKGAPTQAIGSPQILYPGETICFVITNRDTAAQSVASLVRWASPPSIEDYIFTSDGALFKYKGPIIQEDE